MSTNEPYSTPAAVEAAIKTAANYAFVVDPTLTVQERIRLAHFDRFLSRVFSEGDDSDWMLKGGTAMLARVPSTRATTDVDLFLRNHTLDAALEDLRRLASKDLEDFFRFTVTAYSPLAEGNQQADAEGYRVTFETYVGVKSKGGFHVDLVVNVVTTDAVEVARPANALNLPKLAQHAYRLYPTVDQIADKVCATFALYRGRPSTREKDLVDLVVLAATQDVSARKLSRALEAEARTRSLVLPPTFAAPTAWGRVYASEATSIPACADFRTIEEALALMHRFLDPVLAEEVIDSTWSHTALAWL